MKQYGEGKNWNFWCFLKKIFNIVDCCCSTGSRYCIDWSWRYWIDEKNEWIGSCFTRSIVFKFERKILIFFWKNNSTQKQKQREVEAEVRAAMLSDSGGSAGDPGASLENALVCFDFYYYYFYYCYHHSKNVYFIWFSRLLATIDVRHRRIVRRTAVATNDKTRTGNPSALLSRLPHA